MRSRTEMDAPFEMFFLLNTAQECLLHLCRLTDLIGWFLRISMQVKT